MRNSNIELCRIASIALVLLVHSAFAANGFPKELTASSLWLICIESISIIGVNTFIFISGYFSIKLKPRTIYSLVFASAFYYCILTGFSLLAGEAFSLRNLMFISNSHYFILDYLGLTLLSPILNKFCENIDKKTFLQTLLLLLIYQTYFGYFPGANNTEFDYGYSLMSFSIIYLIARYIKQYGMPLIIKKYSGTLYLISTLFMIGAACLFIKIGYGNRIGLIYAYNNPLIIFSSICFFLYFEKQDIKENSFINHIAKSTLGILLFHASTAAEPTVWKWMKETFRDMASDPSFLTFFKWGG